jgi:predicted PhzF superfamily epimerase YddE/YHI9
LGTAAVWAWRRGLATADLEQETISGTQRLHVTMEGRSGQVTLWQNPPVLGETVPAERVLAAVGLPSAAAHPALVPQCVSTGLPALIVPLADVSWLAAVKLQRDQFPLAFGEGAATEPVML